MLRGPSEGEEATKKLLAIGSVKVKLPSPQGIRRNLSVGAQVRRARTSQAGFRFRANLARSLLSAPQVRSLRQKPVACAPNPSSSPH